MRDDHYPAGTVRALLETDFVTMPTAAALKRRLEPVAVHDDLLDESGFALLAAICERLIPQGDRAEPIDIAARLHRQIATGGGDGWRYATLPQDEAAWRAGVTGVDESARALAGRGFVELGDDERDAVLVAVQRGTAAGATWSSLDPKRWFEELLAATCEVYYSHPLAQEEIGYVGMADGHGWDQVGIGARAAHEPVALPTSE